MSRNPLFYMGRTANKPIPAHGEHYNPVLMTIAQHQPRAQANRTSALPWIVVARVEHWTQVFLIF